MGESHVDTRSNRVAKAVALSLLVYPGAGQWVNGQRGKAYFFIASFSLAFGGFLFVTLSNIKTFYDTLTTTLDFAPITGLLPKILGTLALSALLWVVSGIDAGFGVPDPPDVVSESPPPASEPESATEE